jgi:TetR/AcrR family transcriptional regulator, transcriptional repressor for nem operon
MPTTRKHHEQVREKLLTSANRLFNRDGYNAVSIDDVMAEAGLTRGSFYTYFASKTDLYAQSVAHVVDAKREGVNGDDPRFKADQIVRDYLSTTHFDAVDGNCLMVGLPGDIVRTDPSIRQAFETAVRMMVEIFERDISDRAEPDRNRALAIAALCVGGMVLARSVDDRELADEMRQAALAVALTLGTWS